MPDAKQFNKSLATATTLPDSPMAMPEQILESPAEMRPGMSWLTVLVALVGWRVHG
ncbi:hypothetical protein [Mangrovicoccus algicola]|uniref:Uncharacterized protein n=1 Tax=Mangrovicoccus algicola TaxID=2771008 RepID=A0A8J6ZA20_9RHOB|nr:hypothetical protein [Mangrovicoccus algicola]MBE3639140.1 hypothetical protein [Mangrovicoccus algicola]